MGRLNADLTVGVLWALAALPIGIVLALGRRSEMPMIRALSVFIEFWRGTAHYRIVYGVSDVASIPFRWE